MALVNKNIAILPDITHGQIDSTTKILVTTATGRVAKNMPVETFIYDGLDSQSVSKPLSAKQGMALSNMINKKSTKIIKATEDAITTFPIASENIDKLLVVVCTSTDSPVTYTCVSGDYIKLNFGGKFGSTDNSQNKLLAGEAKAFISDGIDTWFQIL